MPAPEVLTRDQVRRIDEIAIRRFGIPGIVLMENAGRAVADRLEQLGIEGPIVICCGRGNNGGDGFVVARQLDGRGYDVEVFLWGDPAGLTGDARTNFDILGHSSIRWQARPSGDAWLELAQSLHRADWIIDALLGTGARGALRPPLAHDVRHLNAAPARRLAIDLPTGFDADTGTVEGTAFRADHTVTLVAAKPGFASAAAREYTGQVHVADIGLPAAIWDTL